MKIINSETLTTNVPGEKWFLDEINDDKYDWTIISNKVLKQNLKLSIREGEFDFLVMIPKIGMSIVEIKSHPNLSVKKDIFYDERKTQRNTGEIFVVDATKPRIFG